MTTYEFQDRRLKLDVLYEGFNPGPVQYDVPPVGILRDFNYDQRVSNEAGHEINFTQAQSLDCGGSGDCFFRCIDILSRLYRLAGFDVNCFKTEDYYTLLNIPPNTWIEDTHISQMAQGMRMKVVVISKLQGTDNISVFGTVGYTYFIENVGNYHYRAVICPEIYEILTVTLEAGLAGRLFQEEGLTENVVSKMKQMVIQSQTEGLDWADSVAGDSMEEADIEEETTKLIYASSSSEEEQESVEFAVLPPSCSDDILFSYLCDFGSMKTSSCTEVLDSFVIVHNTVIDYVIQKLNDRLLPDNYLLKMYYKMRHNTFAFIVSDDQTSRIIDTDTPLSCYIDSDRTPDKIIENEKEIILVEFTVSNRYDMVDFNKGGGIFDLKYTKEAEKVAEVTGKRCRVLVVPAVLDEYNTQEVVDMMKPLYSVNKEMLSRFYSSANKSKKIIANAYLSGYSSSTGLASIKGIYDMPTLNRTEMLDGHFVSIVLKNWGWLSNFVVGIMDRKGPDHTIAFVYEKNNGRIRMIESPKGLRTLRLSECAQILQSGDLSSVLAKMNYRMDGNTISSKEMRGDVAMTTTGQKLNFKTSKWKYITTTRDIYTRTTPAVVDSYAPYDRLPDPLPSAGTVKVLFDDNYFNRLNNDDFENLMKTGSSSLLANNVITEEYLRELSTDFKNHYQQSNEVVDQKFNPKQSFMLPMVTIPCKSTDLDNFNLNVVNMYLKHGQGNYTKSVLNKVAKGIFHHRAVDDSEIMKARTEYSEARAKYTSMFLKQEVKKIKKWSMLADQEKAVLKTPRSEMISKQQKYSSLMKAAKQKQIRTIKLNCGKNSTQKIEFKKEMAHFQKENKGVRGVGVVRDTRSLDEFFKHFVGMMLDTGFNDIVLPPLYNTERGPGPSFLTEDKNFYTARWNKFYDEKFKNTLLEQLTVIGTNLSRLLFNESVKSYNQNYCRIDNLGFEQIVVIVRGGKKAYSRNMSKLFRIGFECQSNHLKYLGYEENEFFEVYKNGPISYVYTPWSQIHLDILYDWFSMRYRSFLNVYSNYTREGGVGEVSKLAVLPTILSLHNRRKTEQLLHNVRYLIVNPLGTYANLKGIIKGFGTYNLSYFDAWLKECLLHRYEEFSVALHRISKQGFTRLEEMLTAENLKDLWFETEFATSDQLTNFIYITYAMTKAPVNASMEQASNIKSILADIQDYENNHGDVDKMQDDGLHMDALNFKESDYDDDFKYDPKFCQFLGYHMAGFLKSRADPNELNRLWERANSKGLNSIANSNGLRGFNKDNFYGKKGYEVVYDYIIEHLESNDIQLEQLVQQYVELDYEGAQQSINADRLSKKELTLDQITFHIVHKIQRGGGREIFCMDLVTKAYQNPLEQFFKGVCRLVPNEFISISANKRHSIIHTDFFERTPAPWIKKTLRWVLDCRRWAPHSVFQKYMHFIHGMSPILPASMVEDFETFGNLMMEKRYITREHVYSTIKNNKSYTGMIDCLKPAPEQGTYQTTVKFSFVMGIFNYLSSLMHAANQLLSSEIIMNYNLRHGNGLVIMDPKCHSDDSAITSYHERSESMKPSVLLYDWLLKCGNHMLSIKKSQVNQNIYMEFLSILYLFDRFVPVIPKFISSIPFKPTDAGYSSDVTFAITQAIEVLMNGGTVEESFLILKLTEKHVQSIYNLPGNCHQPYNFLGNIDAHPVELLLGGAQSEIYKFMKYEPMRFWASVNLVSGLGLIDATSPTDLSVKWDMSSKMSYRLRKKYVRYSEVANTLSKAYPWTLENCRLGNDYLNIIWYVNKLNDPKYYASLTHEPESRRFTRAFGSFKYRTLVSSTGTLISVSKLAVILNEIDLYSPKVDRTVRNELVEILDFVCDDLSSFYQAIESAAWMGDLKPIGYKDKPIYFNFSLPQLSNIRIDANQFISYTREPEAYKLLGLRSNPARQVKQIEDYCTSLNLDLSRYSDSQLYMIINKILNAGEHNFRLIAPVPSQHKKADTFNSVLVYLCHNSIRHNIRTMTSTSTSRVDWKRRVISGRVPEAVLDAIEIQNVVDLADRFKVRDSDIFRVDLEELLLETRSRTPVSWKPLLSASLSKHDSPLINEHYWIFWEKDQVKSGREWYGSGTVCLSVPEALMKINIENGSISEITINDEEPRMFNTTTNWFLGNLFRMSGMTLPMDLSQYQDPNELVFGYHTRSGSYGIDYPNRFDQVFNRPIVVGEVAYSFMFTDCIKKQKGRYWIYDDLGKDRKIEFFVPATEMPTMDMTKYVDIDKVRSKINDDSIRNFCFNLSVEMREEYTFKKDDVVSTVGFSLIYKILYSNPDFIKLYRGEMVKDIFLESIMMWKKNHPDFEFPDQSEIAELAKRSDLPQLPGRIYRYLNKMEISTMRDEDFAAMLTHLYSLPEDERMTYLLSMFPALSKEEQRQTLTIAVRSDRIYESVQMLGKDSFKIFNPVFSAIRAVIENNSCSSQTLASITTRFSKEGNMTHTYDLLLARVVLTGITCLECKSDWDPTVALLFSIVEDLVDEGMLPILEVQTITTPVLNSVKFNVEKEKFMEFLTNIVDGVYLSRWIKVKSLTRSKMIRIDLPEISAYKKNILKIMEWRLPEQLRIDFKTKGKRVSAKLVREEGTPGLPTGVFKPLDEDDQMEYNDGYDWNEDIEEDLLFADVGEAKQMGYVRLESGSWRGLCGVRGTAHTVFIGTHTLSRDMLQAHGEKVIYRKEKFSNLLDYVNCYGYYLLKISESRKNVNVHDFKRMDYTDFFKSESKYKSPSIEIDGRLYDKIEVLQKHKIAQKIAGLDSYFKRISVPSAKKELDLAGKREHALKEIGIEVSQEYLETKKEIENLVRQEDESREVVKSKKKKSKSDLKPLDKEAEEANEGSKGLLQRLDMDKLMEKIKLLASSGLEGVDLPDIGRRVIVNPRINYKEPMKLLQNPSLIGEFNALFGNNWPNFEMNNLRMTALSKRTKMNYMKFQIKAMPKEMQSTYAKVYGIVAGLLADIETCASISHETHELTAAIDSLFDVDLDIIEDRDLTMFLEPNVGEVRREPDLDKIFKS